MKSTGTTFSHASQIAKPPFPHIPPNCHGSEGARGIIMPLPQTNTLFPPHHHAPNEREHLNNTHRELRMTMTILLPRQAPHQCNLHRHVDSDRPPLLLELTADETMIQRKLDAACMTRSKFLALDLVPPNARLN